MSLQDELDQLNKEIEAEDNAALGAGEETAAPEKEEEKPTTEEPDAETVEEKTEQEAEEKTGEDKAEETVEAKVEIPEVKTSLEETPPEGGYARLRWEAAEAKRKAAELERKLAEKEAAKPAASKEENYEAYIESEIGLTKKEVQELKEWKSAQDAERVIKATLDQATNEFIQYEKQFKIQNSAVNDYEDASRHVVGTIYNSIKTLNPDLPNDKLMEATKIELLKRSSKALDSGQNPAGALYKQAYSEFGYRPKTKTTEVEEKPQTTRTPSMAKLAENKKRSANMAGTGGTGAPSVSNAGLGQMTNAELAKLTPSDWERLERESA